MGICSVLFKGTAKQDFYFCFFHQLNPLVPLIYVLKFSYFGFEFAKIFELEV